MQSKKMYHVEKFLPPECPKCRARFHSETQDYVRFFGDIVDGKRCFRMTDGYTIIVCRHCDNMTMKLDLEAYQVCDRDKAESLLKEGFVNLKEVMATGNMAKDHHMVFRGGPKFITDEPESDDPQILQKPVK